MAKRIEIVEVGPRDGLQNEKKFFSLPVRYEFVKKLSEAGLQRIEFGSFVSSKKIPALKNSGVLAKKLQSSTSKSLRKSHLSALVPNEKGMHAALDAGVSEVAIFGSCSESFSQKNINCSIAESFDRFAKVVKIAKKNRVKVRGYLSVVWGCPYEGEISQAQVIQQIQRMLSLGVYEISLGDTIGQAHPKSVEALLKALKKKNIPIKKIALHFHDTYGLALANVLQGLQAGVTVFDSSVGGLGGCPYAKVSAGNLATNSLVHMLHSMGYSTGVDMKKLNNVTAWLEQQLSKKLPCRVPLS